jgi:transcriptional regulator with PAS, ATPase and Fis domain
MCRTGAFREDLYFRLNVITITLPPLRNRTGDVAHLVRFLLKSVAKDVGRELSISAEALAALERWRWPGNVRELENVVRRAAVFSRGEIGVGDLPPPIAS